MSFDGEGTRAKPLEVYGESGALSVPDPNHFDGEVELLASGSREWTPLPTSAGYVNAGRGIGLLDFVSAEPGQERASGALGLHVLEIMTALISSAEEGGLITIASHPARPPLVPLN
ncbi:hypothetical protein BH11ACT3_BH11ACT3_21130 [soil metagenome]